MKTLFTDDFTTIREQFDQLVSAKTKLFCLRRVKEHLPQGELYVEGITKFGSDEIMVINHPQEMSCPRRTCEFFYHIDGNPFRSFESIKVKQAEKYLGLKIPPEIFDIQRRCFPRVATPSNCSVVFLFRNSQRVNSCLVTDVSLAGARVVCDIPSPVEKGDIVSPLTISLFRRYDNVEEIQINVPEATVAWAAGNNYQTNAIGLQFSLQGESEKKLAEYIDLRFIEDRYEPEDCYSGRR